MLTDLSFLEIGEQWPPDSERRRLADYETNRLLFAGEHQNVFSDYLRLLRQDDQAILELIINLPKRLSTLWADLLLGETPRFEAGDTDSDEQATIDRIVADNELAITAYEIAIDTSRYGDGLFKLRVQDRAAVIEAQSPSTWFPVTQPGNIRNITHHVLAWTWEQDNTRYLEAEIHTPGQIEHRIYQLSDGATGAPVIRTALDWASFYPDIPEMETTGVPEFLVIPVAGLRTTDSVFGMDDYGDIASLLHELEIRFDQVSRILTSTQTRPCMGHRKRSKSTSAQANPICPAAGDIGP